MADDNDFYADIESEVEDQDQESDVFQDANYNFATEVDQEADEVEQSQAAQQTTAGDIEIDEGGGSGG